jgi:hypothetical protein
MQAGDARCSTCARGSPCAVLSSTSAPISQPVCVLSSRSLGSSERMSSIIFGQGAISCLGAGAQQALSRCIPLSLWAGRNRHLLCMRCRQGIYTGSCSPHVAPTAATPVQPFCVPPPGSSRSQHTQRSGGRCWREACWVRGPARLPAHARRRGHQCHAPLRRMPAAPACSRCERLLRCAFQLRTLPPAVGPPRPHLPPSPAP